MVIDNGLRLGIGKELNAQLSGKDEIAKLDQVFHSAAEALAEAAGKERAVIENARDVICSVDASEKFTQVNAASYAIWGYESEQLIGKHVSEIIYQDDLESTRQALKRLMNGEEVPAIENRVRRRDGSLIDVNWSLRWSQKERSIFCVAHDITERRELERLKQEFVAMVSHDLRTPLTSIRGSLTLIGEGVFGETSPEAKQRIEVAQKNVNRLINLINDLLDIEKLEAGKMSMHLVPVDIDEVIGESVSAVKALADEKRITIKTSDSDGEVMGDHDRLIQVLVNLLSNAVKFSPEESTITVSTQEQANVWEIRVADQGRGIPSAQLHSVFERFKQSQADDGKRGKGTGLGLAICKAIVESHGGEIGVTSKESNGSTFFIRIPKVTADSSLASRARQA